MDSTIRSGIQLNGSIRASARLRESKSSAVGPTMFDDQTKCPYQTLMCRFTKFGTLTDVKRPLTCAIQFNFSFDEILKIFIPCQ